MTNRIGKRRFLIELTPDEVAVLRRVAPVLSTVGGPGGQSPPPARDRAALHLIISTAFAHMDRLLFLIAADIHYSTLEGFQPGQGAALVQASRTAALAQEATSP